ncbi:MAG TPA: ATP-binding protein [Chloroflexota bacterium]|nr:ATP-binding protein [Chloroflexota bacterium]
MSVRLRLTLWYAGLTVLALVLSSLVLYVVLEQTLTAETDNFLASKARDLAASTQIVGGPLYSEVRLPDLDRFIEADVYAQVIGPGSNVLDESMSMGGAGLPMDPTDVSVALHGGTTVKTVTIRGLPIRVFTTAFYVHQNQPLVLQVGRSFQPIEDTLNWLQHALALGDLILVALTGGVGWWIAGWSLRPIARITKTVQSIGDSQRLDQRVEYYGPTDQIGELVYTFNRMLDRLEASISAQRRFIADASHELRTPLTTLRLNVELLRRDRSAEPPERAEVLEDVASELDRLARLAQGLLDLARADAGLHIEKQPVRADEIIREVYHQVKPTANGVVLQVADLVPINLYANPDYLKQLLLTLVDNALKYTDSGGQVRLDVERDDRWVKFVVSDTGRGIAPEDLPHIFERFYRARSVRRQRGTGLGLAVAQWIAREHGGHIAVQSESGRGSSFTVWLPAN